mmetsp:Transcript_48627/g.89615  ORF Transcript_48627/g.89615 Transcript_48627/m.89615 type:complete len:1291 (+) Transcript_48627:45-3917(+)
MELFTWGSGNYGRLGLGHSRDAKYPQRVGGVLNGYEVVSADCSWYHSAVVTTTGQVATFGSKVTKCLGTEPGDSDVSSGEDEEGNEGSDQSDDEDLLRPSQQVPRPQRRPRPQSQPATGHDHCSAAFVPQVLRSFPQRVTVVQVAVGGDMIGAQCLAVTRSGRLFSWGFGQACGLGTQANVSTPTLVSKFLGFGAYEGQTTSQMEPLAWGRHSHIRYRKHAPERHLGLQILRPKIIRAACGGGFSAVLSSEGEVFTFGLSATGRLGFRTKFRAQLRPRRVETLKEGITDISAGSGFLLLCSAAGRLLAWGDNTKGQLGIGHLQESCEPAALGRACPAAFVFQAVAAGDSHSLALDSAGKVYSWGGEGGPMTGQGSPMSLPAQVDMAYQFRLRALPHWWVRPAPIRALAGNHVIHIAAGCLHSLALTAEGCLFAWGAALQAGVTPADASQVRPEAAWIPRLLAPSPKMPLVRVKTATAGGWHSLAAATSSTAMRSLLWDTEGTDDPIRSQHRELFCDGYLVSSSDSTSSSEARVPFSCAALKARLAHADGHDSPAWIAFASHIQRRRSFAFLLNRDQAEPDGERRARRISEQLAASERRPLPSFAREPPAEHVEVSPGKTDATSAAEEDDDNELDLLDIVQMHRRHKAAGMVENPAGDADEAAGRAVKKLAPKEKAKLLVSEEAPLKPVKATRVVPDFSSDSSDGPARAPPSRGVRIQKAEAGSSVTHPGKVSTQGGSSSSAAGTQARSRRTFRAKGVVPVLALKECSEAVLAALVHFLLTDDLGHLEVIDESHPAWQGEQHLKLLQTRSPGDAETEPSERPSRQRAVECKLLRTEVATLSSLGTKLGLERLTQLCSQMLLRIDAPGAPALFVPPSTMEAAMSTLLNQAMAGPCPDGPDTRLLIGPPSNHKQKWGHPRVPPNGVLYAHGFVLCDQCRNVQVASGNPADGNRDYQGVCLLQPCSLGSGGSLVRFELDLRDVAADVVFAWLRYLYRHEDLTLVWPCGDAEPDAVVLAEGFWTALLRLGQRLGDSKLQLYAQEVLVDCLSIDNWSHLAVFAEQSQCSLLSEAALMTGVRILIDPIMRSFKVPTGLEGADGKIPENEEDDPEEVTEQAATAGRVSFGQAMPGQAGSAYSQVDLDMEKHLMSLSIHSSQADLDALASLKKTSPGQFAELKHRLAERVISARRAAKQLHQCARYFSNQEKHGGLGSQAGRRRLLFEFTLLAVVIMFFMLPTPLRKALLNQARWLAPGLFSAFDNTTAAAVFSSWKMGVVNALIVAALSVLMFIRLKQ